MKCPKCGKTLAATGRAPGSSIACGACGNVTAVPERKSGKGLFVAVIIGAVVLAVPCLGILAAIAIPNFIRFQARAKQAECKTNLKAWYTVQRAFAFEGGYTPSVDRVGFQPERGNRYAYFAGPGPIEERSSPRAQHGEDAVGFGVDTFKWRDAQPITLEQLPPDVAGSLGLSGGQCPEGPDCAITLACAGNVDRDDTLDVWSISTVRRTGPDGEEYMAGEPMHHVDDVKE